MDIELYRRYLNQYLKDALANSDGTHSGITEYLLSIKVSGLLVRHKAEKLRAQQDAIKAFQDHRHWPLEIIISHLGLDQKNFINT